VWLYPVNSEAGAVMLQLAGSKVASRVEYRDSAAFVLMSTIFSRRLIFLISSKFQTNIMKSEWSSLLSQV
jgi:hypothetical protein